MRRTSVKDSSAIALALLLPLGATLAGCAGRKPVAEIARADQAVWHAQSTSEAARYAPSELATARAKLAGARHALEVGAWADARDLADQARAYAELAEEKAESQRALAEARRTLSEVEVLHAETVAAPETIVVERRVVEPAPPVSVVVERPAAIAPAVRQEPTVIVVPE